MSLVTNLVAGQELSDDRCASIVAQADGIPLFIEELTRSCLADDRAEPMPLRLQELFTWRFRAPEIDLRVGGRFRIAGLMPDGGPHRVGGVYREIVPGRKLVFTWAWESTPERESLVTIDIAPTEGGCMLTLTHERFFDEAARAGHERGWTATFAKLESWLQASASSRGF